MNRTFSTTLKLSACCLLLTIAAGCLEENGTSSPSGQVPSQPAPIIVTTSSPCESNKVTIKIGGVITEYASIQLAVNAAQIGQVIHVPRGDWKELVSIVSKENVEISSQCFPSIYGFEISKSKNLKISGFKVLGKPVIISASKNPEKEDREDDNDENDDQDDDELESGSAGFYLKGGSKGNTNIEISKNEIAGISNEYDAIYVGSQNSVKIFKNFIHDNKRNGISFSDSSKGGSHLIEQNQISYNGRNGIVIAKQQTVLIKGNRITYNGIRAPAATKVGKNKSDDDDNSKDGSHKDGYGIKRHGGGDDSDDDDDDKNLKMGSRKITLIDNVIYNNNGRKNKKSSRDISFYKSIFDSEDINNMTTEGYEGSGSVIFVDKIAPRFVSFTEDHIVTKFNQFYLYGFVDDVSKVNSDIYLNGVKIFSTSSNVINVIATLSEGVNTFTFKATDSAGNSADIVILSDIRYDTTPPVLSQLSPTTGSKLYTNKFPFSFMSYGLSNEPLSKVSVGGFTGALEVNKINFSGSLQVDDVGIFQIDYAASDLVGNSSTFTTEVDVVFDDIAPVLASDLLPGIRTKKTTFPVEVSVSDLSPTWTEVWVNNVKVFGTAAIDFTFNAPLNTEGGNLIEIKTQDAAGNVGITFAETVVRDTTPPVLAFVTPLDDGFVSGRRFKVNVSANEPLSTAQLNDRIIPLQNSPSFFELFYSVSSEGKIQLVAQATDVVGNVGTKTINVISMLNGLNKSLLGLRFDESSQKMVVAGAVGTVRPGLKVRVSGGFFNSTEIIASDRGSFQVLMDIATQYEVSVYDPELQDTFAATIIFGQESDVILSGTVRDIDDQPLVGVKVSVANTTLVTETDSNGVFTFLRSRNPGIGVLGDQQLIVDGRTAILPVDTAAIKKYSVTSVAITIGIRQSNVLQTPIYLAPTYLDGSATQIQAASGGLATDIHAPGVALEIPAGAAIFPNGTRSELISMQTIPVERATIPAIPEARPKTVVALEPSGTTFSQPVSLTLPNVNEFPPGTEMILMLMNSGTGKWEVGGAATVSENGSSVVTKTGFGIRHFSLVYATIAGPIVRQIGAKDRPGADTMNGALTTQIQLPGFKILDSSISPTLYYNSNWAKPNAVITNLFDIPNRKAELTLEKRSGAKVASYQAVLTNCTLGASGSKKCYSDPKTFYTNVQYDEVYSGVTSEIQPLKVEASLRTANIAVPKREFKNIPHMANISFGLELKSSADSDEYLPTGLYPYQAHYDVHYKELIMGTSQLTTWTTSMDAQVQSPESFKQENNGVFTSDLTDSIFVQNYRNSEAGTGWKIGGVQRLVNPNGNKIMIEEANGGISTYSIGNNISTVLDLAAQGGDAAKGVALNAWPRLAFGSSDGKKIFTATYSQNLSKSEIASQYNMTGTVAGFDYYSFTTQSFTTQRTCTKRNIFRQCTRYVYTTIATDHPNSYCSQGAANFTVGSNPTQLLMSQDGEVIGADSYRHSVFRSAGGITESVLGATQPTPNFPNYYQQNVDDNKTEIEGFCRDTSGSSCSTVTSSSNTYAYFNGCPTQGPVSKGEVPVKGDSLVNNQDQSLNTPMGLAPSFYPNTVIVLDTGNHRVRGLNTVTNQSWVIAGNGQTSDTGNGELATDASLFHPRGAAYDRNGNLYISTENGLIKRVDPNGIIATIAGDPVNGVLSNEGPARTMLLNKPYGLVVDNTSGFLYIADTGHNRVVRINLFEGTASTVAGTGQQGFSGDGKSALEASISSPTLLGLDSQQNLLILDSGNNKIRRVIFQTTSVGTLAFNPTAKDNSVLTKREDGTWERAYRNGLKALFTQEGIQYATQDRIGLTTNYEYDSLKRLSTITFSNGQAMNYSYRGDRLFSIKDPAGRVTIFDYDWHGKLTNVKFQDGTSKLFEYNNVDFLSAEINQRGIRTSYLYNSQNRIEKIIDSKGSIVTVNDQTSGTLASYNTSVINEPASTGFEQGQGRDQLISPLGQVTEVAKDFNGFISKMKDAKGNITELRRDTEGNIFKIIYPDNSITEIVRDPITDDVLITKDITLGAEEKISYNSFGQVTSKANYRGKISTFLYDPISGLKLADIFHNGQRTEYSYNPKGQLKTKVTYVSGRPLTEFYEYDLNGNLAKTIKPDGNVTIYENDSAGNRLKEIKQTMAGTAITHYEWNTNNKLTKVTSPNGEITSYKYLPTGELSEIIDPKNKTITYDYDEVGNMVKRINQLGLIAEYSYDKNRNLQTEKDPNNQSRIHSYDELNKLKSTKYADDFVSYEYNSRGAISKISNSVSSIAYDRNHLGWINNIQVQGLNRMSSYPLQAIEQQFDLNGNRTVIDISGLGKFTSAFDDLDRQVNVSNTWGDSFNFSFDTANRLVETSRPGSKSQYSYTDSSEVSEINHLSGTVTKSFVHYLYDANNFPVQRTTRNVASNFGYDLNGQLISVSTGGENFSYDSLGNRTTDNSGSYSYDSTGQRLTEDAKFYYSYDNNGNLISKTSKDTSSKSYMYKYSAKNQLIEIGIYQIATGVAEKKINFEYDALGRRMEKTIIDYLNSKTTSRRYVYDSETIVGEFDESNRLLVRHTHSQLNSDDILSSNVTSAGVEAGVSQYAGNFYYYKDEKGTTIDIADNAGAIVQSYDYSSFGKINSIRDESGQDVTLTAPFKTAFTFTGREWEEESGLYYYRARYYDPSIGRFLQQDPDVGFLMSPLSFINRFSYSYNSPVKYSDPTGKNPLLDLIPNVHGNYCGGRANGNKGRLAPRDDLDQACADHDEAWGPDDYLRLDPQSLGAKLESDVHLLKEGLLHMEKSPLTGYAIAHFAAINIIFDIALTFIAIIPNMLNDVFNLGWKF